MKGEFFVAAITAAAIASAQKYPIEPRSQRSTALFKTISYTTCSQEPDATVTALELTTVTFCATCAQGRNGNFPYTTVYETVYPDVCTCTEGMQNRTYTITEGCTQAPASTWSFARSHIPPGFTTTTVMCHNCPAGPTPVCVTRPVPSTAARETAPPAPTGEVPATPAAPGTPAPSAPAGCSGPGCPVPAPAGAPPAPSGIMPSTGSRGSNSSNITPNIEPAFPGKATTVSVNHWVALGSLLIGLIPVTAILL